MTTERNKVSLMSGGTVILLILIAIGAAAAIYRLAVGLGPATNLNDAVPWGLWVGIDVLVGVALAAGGFTITAGVYILNLKKYKPVARPAILTAFIGYLLVLLGLIFDLGKSASFWHPLVMWQPHSVMFEIVWCVALYTTVLALEFAPPFLEGIGNKGLAKALQQKWILYPLVIAGITLSYGHQSSMGGLFLLMPSKLHGLWWTPILPQVFFLSAVAVGLAMVSFESIISSRVFKRGYETDVLKGLARGTAIALLVYLVVRLGDLAMRGNLGLIFSGGKPSLLFLVEVVGGVVLPMIMLFGLGNKANPVGTILWAQVLVIAGVVFNRMNVVLLTQAPHGGSYFPAIQEFAITLGLIALGIFMYRLAAVYLPVFSHAEGE